MQKLYLVIAFAFAVVFHLPSHAQSVLNPADTIREYDTAKPPVQPPAGQIGKWVRTKKLSWNTTSYKAYIYNGIAFRLKFPKTYVPGVNDGKQYPMLAFFHGAGEKGDITDNEYQLYHGGSIFSSAVDNGKFDGYVLFMQSTGGFWGTQAYQVLADLINYMIVNNKLDPFRVSANGLSAGGQGTWEMMINYPTYVAADLPISSNSIGYKDASIVNSVKWTPIWNFQGGLDGSPAPSTSQQVRDAMLAAGGNYTYTEYPTLAHASWNQAWSEPDFFPFLLRAHKANPWSLTGRTAFCPGDPISATLGVTAGFDAYEWRKDSVLISGATTNQLTINALGTYDCRVKRGSIWSPWSPTPVVIKIKAPTVSPNIQVSGLASKVLPAPDSSTTVQLEVPAGYASYQWKRTTDTLTLGTTRYLNAAPGTYRIKVTEQFGCSSDFSAPFAVVNANGAAKPDAPIGLSANTLSKTQVKLIWSENPNPVYNETSYEIYQATTAQGAYKLIAFTGRDTTTYTVNGLNANTTYFYKVRAINDSAASAVAGPANATTQADTTAPTAPANLRTGTLTNTSVQLLWDASSDDVAVTSYDVYVNGTKAYVTDQTSFTLYNLAQGQPYTFLVKARDLSGNNSPFSNQVSAGTGSDNLTYKYYRGQWTNLPNFAALTPVQTGTATNVNLNNRLDNTNFGFLWEGYINIPVTGSYTFQTTSDDGTRLYIDTTYSYTATPLINNDGVHTAKTVASSTITLTAGVHRFALAYFQQSNSSYSIGVTWKTPQTSNKFVAIPDSAFTQKFVPGSVPAAPSGLTATAVAYNRINLAWQDNSTDETGFEIYRSANGINFVTIGTLRPGKTTFTDSLVQASSTYFYKVRAINQNGGSAFNVDTINSLKYRYYEASSFSALPRFSSLTPVKSGIVTKFDLSVANRTTQYAMAYDGFVKINTAGTYTFYTSSDDGSKLYIDGATDTTGMVVNNDGLHGATEKSGLVNLTAGYHKIRVTFFQATGGVGLTVSYASPSVSKRVIPDSVLASPPVSATSLAMPGAPSIPDNFSITRLTSSSVTLNWKNTATNKTGYELYRSSNNNSSYILLARVAATDSVTYVDSSLFANATYYYKVRTTGIVNPSGYTPEISATTLNNLPVVDTLPNQSMRFGTQLQLNVNATDADNEQLSTVLTNLPAFGSFVSTGNGTGTLTFNPQAADLGVYNNITLNVTDQHGGSKSVSFTLNVTDNYNPAISGNTAITANEGATTSLTLTATDQNTTDSIGWSFQNLPAFVSPVIAQGTVVLNINPGYADKGIYTVTVIAADGRGGLDNKTVTITVNDVNPNKKIYVDFSSGATTPPSPWNSTAKPPAQNDVYGPFKDDAGALTPLRITVVTPWQAQNNGTNENGANTFNNTGVYPDAVMTSAYFTSNGTPQTFKITGLDTISKYNLTFFGSRSGVTDDRTTVYTVSGTSVSLNAAANSRNTVSINSLKADADSTLTVTLKSATTSPYGYINALVIEKVFSDGTTPATPKNLVVTALPQGSAGLTWTPVAYNEDGYLVYRSTTADGPFTQIGIAAAKAGSYTDSLVSGYTTYYYKVQAYNNQGTSVATNVVSVTIPGKPPVLAAIADQYIKGDQTTTVAVSSSLGASQSLTLTATGLPSFARFTDNGNATGSLVLQPSNAQLGTYSGTSITATDSLGNTSTKTFSIIVKDKTFTSVYIDFNEVNPEPWPWNSFTSAPAAGTTISNAKDDFNNNSGINVTLLDAWAGSNTVGAVTGNNSGVYSDNVMSTAYYESATAARRINITGLSTAKRYNLVLFASRGGVTDSRITQYSVGTQTVSLNAAGNTTNTVQLSGLIPDSTGQITLSVAKDATSSYAYINAMVIQAYTYTPVPPAPVAPAAPTTLNTFAQSRNAISLTWKDVSNNETGFEIWRSGSYSGSFTLLDTVAANVTKYTNSNLAANSKFYYRVRAKAGSNYSDYSNVSGASVLSFQVYIQFNKDYPAGTPWNSTNNNPQAGSVYQNFKNDLNTLTGINMTVGEGFNGMNPYGMNTGNNSGVYPDNVLRSTWWLDINNAATLKIDGLNQSMKYNFVFCGSRDGNGDGADRTTTYSIGSSSASLNCTSNISQTTQVNGISPDQNGSVTIQIKAGGQSVYGYISSLVIQAANGADTAANTSPFSRTAKAAGSKPTTANNLDLATVTPATLTFQAGNNTASAYPNPFVNNITLRLSLKKAVDKMNVVITDFAGRTLFVQDLRNLPQGVSQQTLRVNGARWAQGLYLIRLNGFPGKDTTLQVVK